jgi:glucose-6-phosphate-specific signal transduction histidine kinase
MLPVPREAAGLLFYALAWIAGYYVSTDYWFLPAGLRFATLWCAPRRLWPWLAVAEFAAIAVVVSRGAGYGSPLAMLLGTVMPWATHAAVIALGGGAERGRMPDTPRRMTRLLLVMLAAGLVTSIWLTWMRMLEDAALVSEPVQHALVHVVGDMIAMLALTPIAIHLMRCPRSEARRIVLELLLLFLPLLALVVLVPGLRPRASIYAALLALVPMVTMVFRHGWPGGGWGLAFTSLAVYVLAKTIDPQVPRDIMQLFLAVLGAVTLMLGAAVTALRQARDQLAARGDTLALQADTLRALSQRLVRAQEETQRHVAQDLQGEIEQGITALGTHLGLLARTPLEPAQMAAVDTLRGLTQDIHASMRDVLQQLRPVALDRHGLEGALRAGPIQDLLARSQVRSELSLKGDVAALDGDAQSAIYRICQEAANDCVRRARAPRIDFRISVEDLPGIHFDVLMMIRYEEQPPRSADDAVPSATPLPGTRDRVLALGGDYRCIVADGCTEHRIQFVRLDPVVVRDLSLS